MKSFLNFSLVLNILIIILLSAQLSNEKDTTTVLSNKVDSMSQIIDSMTSVEVDLLSLIVYMHNGDLDED